MILRLKYFVQINFRKSYRQQLIRVVSKSGVIDEFSKEIKIPDLGLKNRLTIN